MESGSYVIVCANWIFLVVSGSAECVSYNGGGIATSSKTPFVESVKTKKTKLVETSNKKVNFRCRLVREIYLAI